MNQSQDKVYAAVRLTTRAMDALTGCIEASKQDGAIGVEAAVNGSAAYVHLMAAAVCRLAAQVENDPSAGQKTKDYIHDIEERTHSAAMRASVIAYDCIPSSDAAFLHNMAYRSHKTAANF